VAEIQVEVPGVIEGDRFVSAGAADNFGEDLTGKVVTNY
jgi:hypothetical protein